jgi:hypothetical protein
MWELRVMSEELEARKLALEERRFEVEIERQREEAELKKAELAHKKEMEERSNSLHFTPATTAIIAGILSLVTGGLTASVGGFWSLRAQQEKNIAELELKDKERQFQIVIKATENRTPDEAAKNLLFFVDIGYLSDSDGKIRRKAQAGETPVISSPTNRQISDTVGASLIKSDGTRLSVDNVQSALDEIIEKITKHKNNQERADNFILYVHGRGKEPEQSLREVMPELEKEYSASVLMFHWFPSYNGPIGYPREEAEAVAPQLKTLLEHFQEYKDKHRDKFQNLRATLLVHSMGNLVLKTLIETYDKKFKDDLFDTIILNAADVDAMNHAQWVRKVNFTKHLYITINDNDSILRFSAKSQRGGRLGQSLTTVFGRDLPLAENANYVDFSSTKVNHRYFLKKGQNDNLFLEEFYDVVLNGKSISLDDFNGIKEIIKGDGNKIYVFKSE